MQQFHSIPLVLNLPLIYFQHFLKIIFCYSYLILVYVYIYFESLLILMLFCQIQIQWNSCNELMQKLSKTPRKNFNCFFLSVWGSFEYYFKSLLIISIAGIWSETSFSVLRFVEIKNVTSFQVSWLIATWCWIWV